MKLYKGIIFVLFLWCLPIIIAIAQFGFGGFWNKKGEFETK